ncbi:MAG: lipid-A-disaccharide synthase [Planctomycetales bacterium]|nr:lipid-A-disaccharide synthase [Planctomycetales bacterium]
MKIFFSVGEPSGDLHGANLIRKLHERDPSMQFVGYGGPRMQQAGCELNQDLTQLAVMGFIRVFTNIRAFWRLLWQADRYFRDHRPDAVVMIDFPGFNWWIARRARVHGIPVFYYGTPQMWAWAGWRVRKMRKLVDYVLCKLPFEVDWYESRGCRATYVGHPYFDELHERQLDRDFLSELQVDQRPLVTILPGSRDQEVQSNLRWFLRAGQLIQDQVPNVRFAIAAFRENQAELARELVSNESVDVEVYVNRTPELIHVAHSCLACSGSVSLELLFHEKPAVIHYHVGRIPFFLQGFFRKVRYITLVNLLAAEDRYCENGELYNPRTDVEKVPYPEYLTCTDKTLAIADHVIQWLTDETTSDRVREQLRSLKADFAHQGASDRAADFVLKKMGDRTKVQSHRSKAA